MSVVAPQRVVLHLDMDAFFASVEQREAPELRGHPVVVGGDPKNGTGRGVVAAASYEARQYGIHSAQPISQAWRACPHAAFVRPRHGLYSEISRDIFTWLEDQVDAFEPASIDEAYAEVTQRCRPETGQDADPAPHADPFDEARRLAAAIQRRVRRDHDLTLSVGIAPNKLVAKIATDLNKPDGITVVPPDRVAEVLGPLPAKRIPGVGPKTAQALAGMGITTIAQLAAADPAVMADRFGTWGPGMVRSAQGHDDRPVDPTWERKSVGAERTYFEDRPPEDLPKALDDVAEEAVDRLRRAQRQARTITVKVRLADFETFTRARTLQAPTDDERVVRQVARALLADAEVTEKVRLLGVRLSQLTAKAERQATLDEWPVDVVEEMEGGGSAARWRPKVWRFRPH